MYAYKQVFQFNAYAKAGAFAVIIFIFLFLAMLYSMRITKITKEPTNEPATFSTNPGFSIHFSGFHDSVRLVPDLVCYPGFGTGWGTVIYLEPAGDVHPIGITFENYQIMLAGVEHPFLTWMRNSFFAAGFTTIRKT